MHLQALLVLACTALSIVSASPINATLYESRDIQKAADGMDIAEKVLNGIKPLAEAAGPEAEIAVDIVSFAVKILDDIFGGIAKAEREDAAKRGAFTQKVVDGTRKAHPGWNVVIVHPKHTTNFQGVQGKDWSHQHRELDVIIGGTIGYEIYTTRAGEFELLGDGGYMNWAWGGPNIKATGNQNHHLIFNGAAPKAKGKSGQCGVHVNQYQKNEKKVNPTNHYTLDIQLKDAAGTVVGFSGMADASKAVGVKSQLPNVFMVTAGSVDKDPLSFAYGAAKWKSSDKQCKVGKYDKGERQMDCSFTCKF